VQARISGYRFSIGELHFLDNSNSLIEVLDIPEMTTVAGTANWFAGLATVKSEMLPVTDFRAWLGLTGNDNSTAESGSALASNNNSYKNNRRLLVVRQRAAHLGSSGEYSESTGDATGSAKKGGEQIGVIVDQVIGYTEALANSSRHAGTQSNMQTLSPSDWLGRLLSGATPIRNLTPVSEQRIATLVSRILEDVLIVGEQTLLICDLSRLLSIPSLRDIRSESGKQTQSGVGAEVIA